MNHQTCWWNRIWVYCFSYYFNENKSFFKFKAILCTWVVLKQSYALCSDFLHLKQSSFLNNSFWIKLRFNLLSFFYEETDDVSQAVNVLETEWAAWIVDVLTTNQAFNSINLTSTCMQMLTNSFKFVIHSLSIIHWRFELILCWRSFNVTSVSRLIRLIRVSQQSSRDLI